MHTRLLAVLLGSSLALACSSTPASPDTSAADAGADTASLCPIATAPAGFHGSCESVDSAVHTCEDFTGSGWAASGTDQACISDGAKFSATTPCPTAGLVGRCLYACSGPGERLAYVYDGDEATAKASCEGIGAGKWLGK